jgi:hypothetical protein
MAQMFEIDGVPGLQVLELMGMAPDQERIRQLREVHLRHFPDHAHVVDEMEMAIRSGTFDPAVVIHQWLLLIDDEPVGEYIFHVNTRRGIMLRHFLAIDQLVRKQLPLRWLASLTATVQSIGERDAADHGVILLAMMSEIKPNQLEGWRRLGYRTFEIGYREPFHGKHWADFGEPTFFEMTPCVKLTTDGERLPITEVATAAVLAFLVDHYRLPEGNATVQKILTSARTLVT